MIKKRLYISGLPEKVSSSDLEQRFASFGNVSNPEVVRTLQGTSRGFGYISIEATEKDLQKCMLVYNKTKWKGVDMKVEEAKEHFGDKLKREREEPPKKEKQRKKKRVKASARSVHAPNMTPLTSNEPRLGWAKGKFSRLVCIMHIRDPLTRKLITVDPSKTQHHLKKLRCDLEIETPTDKLTWYIDEKEPLIKKITKVIVPEVDMTDNQTLVEIDIDKERRQALDVLNSMFGIEKAEPNVHISLDSLETSTPMDYNNEPLAIDLDQALKETIPNIVTSTDNKPSASLFQVNTNLRSLVFGEPSAVKTSLFGSSANETSDPNTKTTLFSKSLPESVLDVIQPIFGTSKFFFVHFDDDDNNHNQERSVYHPDFSFIRTNSLDEIEKTWEMNKKTLTDEYKFKHKSSYRKKAKNMKFK